MPVGATPTPVASSPRPPLRSRFLLAALTLAVFVGIPEAVVRIRAPLLNGYRAVYFGRDPNSPVLFEEDPVLHWKLRPGTDVLFLGTRVHVNANGLRGPELKANCRNILVTGDSCVFGWRVDDHQSLPAQLQDALADASALSSGVQVINAGVPGYTTLQVLLRLPALFDRFHPDTLVICIGNNEAWPAASSDAQRDRSRTFRVAVATLTHLLHSLAWVRDHTVSKPEPFIAASLAGAGPRIRVEESAANMRAIIRLAAERGVRVIVLEPPVNLYAAPAPLPDEPGTREWNDWYNRCIADLQAGEATGVLARCEAALRDHPDAAYATWMKGFALCHLGRRDAGEQTLEHALDLQVFPRACKPAYRAVFRQVAAEFGVPYLETSRPLRDASPEAPGRLFLDHCHPTPQGYSVMVSSLAPLLRLRAD